MFQRGHHAVAQAFAAAVGADRDGLDVSGAVGTVRVQDPALDEAPVGDRAAVGVAHQGVDAAEGVLPVLVGEVALEGGVEQLADPAPFGGGEL